MYLPIKTIILIVGVFCAPPPPVFFIFVSVYPSPERI